MRGNAWPSPQGLAFSRRLGLSPKASDDLEDHAGEQLYSGHAKDHQKAAVGFPEGIKGVKGEARAQKG